MAAFTAIAAGVGMATGLASMGMSFKQASDAAEMEAEALAATDELMEEAKKKAEIDYAQTLNVPLSAFGKEFDQNTANQNAIVQSLQEGDARNLAAGVGRVNVATTDANEDTRNALGDKMYELDKYQSEAKQAINTDQKNMLVGAAADKAQMSRDAAEAKTSAMQGAFQGLGQAASSAASLAPLYGKSAADRSASNIADGLDQSLLKTSVVNQPGTTVEGQKQYANYVAAGDMKNASLFAPTSESILGRSDVISRLQDGRFTDEQLKAYKKSGVYDQSFYDILNR
jgi:hypothetical protein